MAKDICNDQDAPNCVKYIGYVQRAMNLIIVVAPHLKGGVGATLGSPDTHDVSSPAKRDTLSSSTFGNSLHQALHDDGWKYDVIEHVDVSKIGLRKRHDEPELVHRFIARNLVYNDQANTSDVAFNYFDNGDLNLHFAGDFGTLPSNPTQNATIQRRGNSGAGFKVATTTRTQSKLTRSHQDSMANAIAESWQFNAAYHKMSDYIGLVKTSHHANFYFRIIPETKGFGLNYESVNICGELKGFLAM